VKAVLFAWKRAVLLNKRLLKKPSFLVILLLVPILVLLLGAAAREGSGMLTVALAMQDKNVPTTNAIVSELLGDSGLVHFIDAGSPKTAQALLEQGKADAAWIFPEEMQKKIDAFAAFPNERNGFVAVIQREESVFLRLSHEKLNRVLYPYLSLALCENYVYKNILTVDTLSKEQLKSYYDAVNAEGEDLFAFVYANGETPADTENANYLLSPVRGLLAVMLVLGGLAAVIFYMQDEAAGVFDRLPRGKRFWFSVGYPAVAVVDMALAVFAALGLAGLLLDVWYEAAVLLLYGIISAGFCMGLRLLLPDGRILAVAMPVLAAAMIVLCPIFINPPTLPVLQYLLPSYHYLNAVYEPKYIGHMAVYAAAVYGLDWLLYRIRSR